MTTIEQRGLMHGHWQLKKRDSEGRCIRVVTVMVTHPTEQGSSNLESCVKILPRPCPHGCQCGSLHSAHNLKFGPGERLWLSFHMSCTSNRLAATTEAPRRHTRKHSRTPKMKAAQGG